MTVQPVYFDIPLEIAKGLDNGTLRQFGGVVRDN